LIRTVAADTNVLSFIFKRDAPASLSDSPRHYVPSVHIPSLCIGELFVYHTVLRAAVPGSSDCRRVVRDRASFRAEGRVLTNPRLPSGYSADRASFALRPYLNDPPTPVGGIPRIGHPSRRRPYLNHPPTPVWGIPRIGHPSRLGRILTIPRLPSGVFRGSGILRA
jgi:hypothetical protein